MKLRSTLLPLFATVAACQLPDLGKDQAATLPSGSVARAESRERPAAPASAAPVADGLPTSKSKGEPDGSLRQGLRIIEGRTGMTESGFVHIPGELVNETGQWLQLVSVQVVLLDASGSPIGVGSIAAAEGYGESTVVSRAYIAPGERGYFSYLRDAKKLAAPYASHRLSAYGFPSNGNRDAKLEKVDVTKDEDGHFRVAGSLQSTGTLGCKSPTLVWGSFAADGKMIDSHEHTVDATFQKELAPGQSVAAETKIYDFEKQIAEVRAYGACQHSD